MVAAVGFKGRRLEIPSDVNPQVAAIIESCWAKYVDSAIPWQLIFLYFILLLFLNDLLNCSEPWKRPAFSSIMDSLKSLLKPLPPQPLHTDMPNAQ